MQELNPYAAPTSDAGPRSDLLLEEDRVVTPEIMQVMAQTRPWVVFFAILGFTMCALMAVLGIVSMAMSRTHGAAEGLGGAIVYVGFAAVYVFPCLALLRYGASIRELRQGMGVHALTDALRQQKSFWRYMGIVAIIGIGFNVLVGGGMLLLM